MEESSLLSMEEVGPLYTRKNPHVTTKEVVMLDSSRLQAGMEKTSTVHSPIANASPRYEENLFPVAVSRVDLLLG